MWLFYENMWLFNENLWLFNENMCLFTETTFGKKVLEKEGNRFSSEELLTLKDII